jgi:hypothetical protein
MCSYTHTYIYTYIQGWVMSIARVLAQRGHECVHESECDEGCVSKQFVLQVCECMCVYAYVCMLA